jgi:truncated hemoglobin YjbI
MNIAIATPQPVELNRDAITQSATRFHDDVRADDILGPKLRAHAGSRWASHLPRRVEFRSSVAQSSRRLSGKVLARHMALPVVMALRFERWMRWWSVHTQALHDRATARQLQTVAAGIACDLHGGHFGHRSGFDVIASEIGHDGR